MSSYEKDGSTIYKESFRIIRAEADLSRFSPVLSRTVVRMIHACGMTDLAADGQLTRQRRRGMPFRTGQMALTDSPARRRATDRLAAHEPVLTVLATAVGIDNGTPDADPDADVEAPSVTDDAVATVLAAVNDAVTELESVRQRRAIEQAAFDNIWRGNGG